MLKTYMPAELAKVIALHNEMFGGYRMQAGDDGDAASPIDYKAKYEETIAESRKWESRAKENSAAAARLTELEAETKKRIDTLEAENNSYKAREQVAAWKAEVSSTTGIPAAALSGSTKEELEAHADVLKPLMAPAAPVIPSQGQEPDKHGAASDERAFVRNLFGGDE